MEDKLDMGHPSSRVLLFRFAEAWLGHRVGGRAVSGKLLFTPA